MIFPVFTNVLILVVGIWLSKKYDSTLGIVLTIASLIVVVCIDFYLVLLRPKGPDYNPWDEM